MFCQHMRRAPSICVMGPHSSNNIPLPLRCPGNQYSQGSRCGRAGEKVPTAVCGICVCTMFVWISDLCLRTCARACITWAHTCKSCPFMTTQVWQHILQRPRLPRRDRGHLSAIWGLFCHSSSSSSHYPISRFPRGTLSLLPSAGTACILIN